MDIDPLDIVRKVWLHYGAAGNVWVPNISSIGVKGKEAFHEGKLIDARNPVFPDMRQNTDWYWTPGVSSSPSRKAKQYPAQRAIWVDCDESYDVKLLEAMRPSFMWETSPGHRQAIWLMAEKIDKREFHRDGIIGMLTQALSGDKSGVDIGQLLRVPGSFHHKKEEFKGRVLRSSGTVFTRGQLLSRVARGLGFAPQLASELGSDDPYGDRSKLLWKFGRNAAELGLEQDLTFKLIKATKWNKWKDEPDRLKEDIARAYAGGSATPEVKPAKVASEDDSDEETELVAWKLDTIESFKDVMHKPITWVLPGIIPEGGCGMLIAAPKTSKTRVAIEIALGLATGRRPLGLAVKHAKPVLFLSLEDGKRLFGTRLNRGINEVPGRHKYHYDGHINPDMSWEPSVPMPLYTDFQALDLSEENNLKMLRLTIESYELKLVIIDTLQLSIGKAEISSSKEMTAILKELRRMAQETGCAIMFIHHTRKRVFEKGESVQEMIMGSTVLHGWSDFIMGLTKVSDEKDSLLRLSIQTKMKDSYTRYLDRNLRIVKQAPEEEAVA